MKKYKLNEGVFKDIEQTIIDQDDPDYIKKDRERMFNSLVETDKKKKREAVYDWICNNVYLEDPYRKTLWLTREEENKYFKVDFTDEDNPVIDIITPNFYYNMRCRIYASDCETSRFTVNGELPYKFGRCEGSFFVTSYDETDDNPTHKCIGQLHSFKNFPDIIYRDCEVSGENCKEPLITTGLSTLPKNFEVKGNLRISHNMIDSVKGMPAIKIHRGVGLDHNMHMENLEGWNPDAQINISGNYEDHYVDFQGCTRLKSIADLPDDFSCNNLILYYCHIEDGTGLPNGLSANYIDLHMNCLTVKNLHEHPFPENLKANGIQIRAQRTSDGATYGELSRADAEIMPIAIPAGVNSVTVWGGKDRRTDPDSLKCEYFKWLT